ncbi:AraC-like DNA-binding protein [Paenibacillus sp. V4I9]|uniref:AraC family transcriptional regulator n=1 Tax=Paenibacillus sp. V4I9 TaxID=3042308 RepID=UPI002783BF6D|nr:AraC family transcriptional regulator [Paenibacillus sp. V4I9]MDQ0887844.1 AraC-like DNA-binding protein [Paenibacillus sp. V4I9]
MRVNHYLPQPRFSRYMCYPESFGHYKEETNHREKRTAEQVPYYNLHVVMSGTGYVVQGNQKVRLHAGTGFLYGEGMPQEYYSDEGEPWDIRWVHFFGEGLPGLFDWKMGGKVWVFAWVGVTRLPGLLDQLLVNGESFIQEKETQISALLYEILMELLQNGEDLNGTPAIGLRQTMLKTADWIKAECTNQLTLEHMAAFSGYSSYYFSRQFHQIMGKTPSEFLLESRLLKAKELLSSTNWSVKHIAERLGFSQCSYFIRRFRLAEGHTPEQFRVLRGVNQSVGYKKEI